MEVIKRNGTKVDFDEKKIEQAIMKAALETGEMIYKDVFAVTVKVSRHLLDIYKVDKEAHQVESIQDLVEAELMKSGFCDTAKAYILYRAKRAEQRGD